MTKDAQILVLVRGALSRAPAWEWGAAGQVRVLTRTDALDLAPPPGAEVRHLPAEHFDAPARLLEAVLAEHRRRRFARIEAFDGRDALVAAQAREALGLPGQRYPDADTLDDAVAVRRAFIRAGLPVTDTALIAQPGALLEFVDKHEDQLVSLFGRYAASPRPGAVLSGLGQAAAWLRAGWEDVAHESSAYWVAEALPAGSLLRLEVIADEGRVDVAWPAQLTDPAAWHRQDAGVRGVELLDPCDPLVREARELVRRAVEVLPRARLTAFHLDVWITDGDEMLLGSVHPGVGGALAAQMDPSGVLEQMLRRRLVRAALDPARIGRAPKVSDALYGAFALIPHRPGRVIEPGRLPGHLHRPWLLDLSVPGAQQPGADRSASRPAAQLLVTGHSRAEARARARAVTDHLLGAEA